MAWQDRAKVERPEYPKMVPVPAMSEEVQDLLSAVRLDDPEAELVDAGERGTYLKVHNGAAETAARLKGEPRSFPLAGGR